MFPPRLVIASVATQSSVRSGLPRRSAPRNDVASRSIIDAFRRAAGALASRHTTGGRRAMGLKLAIGMVAAMLAACGPDQAPEPAAGTSETLLVGNKGEDTLSFIDLATGKELGRAQTGHMPHEIAISPDGKQAAVVAYGGKTIDIFDVALRAKVRTLDLGENDGPHGLVWLDDGRLVATTERSRTLTLVDTRNGDTVSAIPTGQRGHQVAISPDKIGRVHVGNPV